VPIPQWKGLHFPFRGRVRFGGWPQLLRSLRYPFEGILRAAQASQPEKGFPYVGRASPECLAGPLHGKAMPSPQSVAALLAQSDNQRKGDRQSYVAHRSWPDRRLIAVGEPAVQGLHLGLLMS